MATRKNEQNDCFDGRQDKQQGKLKMKTMGRVSLVGGGPGDPELITLRGRDRLVEADVVIYDELAGLALLDFCPVDCARIYVGKRCGEHAAAQAGIIDLLIWHARAGRNVVRLKGGDPFIFGRGGEELTALLRAEIPCEVVPGITAAAAAAAAAGVPLTHRALSSAVVFLTGHENPDKSESSIDWASYAQLKATLCIYMGGRRMAEIAAKLIAGGMAPEMSAAVVSRASRPDQQIEFFTLASLTELNPREIKSPTLVIIGDVVRLPSQVPELASVAAVF